MVLTAFLVAATVTAGLSAGLFYTFFFSVMPGLGSTDDRTFVAAMQWINARILNGWFAIAFVGAPLLTVAAAIVALAAPGDATGTRPWTIAAAVLALATVAITAAANVPLNNMLEAAGEPDKIVDPAGLRARFERPWVRWNNVRTATSVAAFACMVGALAS
ncbi:MAG TPA: DUF1772 domain-containing protein [Micromonosporaceae bacterium]|nr:DUF1772 domain-containing protein [Micromonosporaceae bacterium]